MCAFWLNTYRCEKYEHFWASSLLKFDEFYENINNAEWYQGKCIVAIGSRDELPIPCRKVIIYAKEKQNIDNNATNSTRYDPHTLPLSHPPTITPSPSHYHTLTLPLSHPLLHSPTVADIKCPFINCVTWRALVLDARNLTNHTLYSSLPQLHSASSIQYLNITAHTSTPVYVARLPSEDYGKCVCVG